jgi:hypothetical protein
MGFLVYGLFNAARKGNLGKKECTQNFGECMGLYQLLD